MSTFTMVSATYMKHSEMVKGNKENDSAFPPADLTLTLL